MGADEYRRELADLAALTAAHLRHERDLANAWIPEVSSAPSRVEAAPPAKAGASQPAAPIAGGRSLEVLAEEAMSCTRCELHTGRTRSVFSRGSAEASLVFVGEGPGYNEDQEGLPFVGKAGKLLDKMIVAMGFPIEEVYICNVVKCRPPENRTPKPEEAAACLPFLEGQLQQVRPEMIVALGRHAAENLGLAEPGRRWRGEWGRYAGVRVMPTYHPAYLLRSPEQKRVVWDDLKAVVEAMGRELPRRR